MDSAVDGAPQRSSFAEASVITPVPSPSETETALVPFEPICLQSSPNCQASVSTISSECVPMVATSFNTTDILTDLQGIYAKVQNCKLDSELAILSEKDKRKDLERQLAEKKELLEKALAEKNALVEALLEKEDQVENLKQQVDEDNERYQKLGSILEHFRILKTEENEKEITLETSVNLKTTTGNTNPPPPEVASPSSSNRMGDPVTLPISQPTTTIRTTVQTADAFVQTDSKSKFIVKNGVSKSLKIKHGVDTMKSDAGFYCLCGTQLKRKHDLRDHIRSNDPASYVFQCNRCDKKFWRTTDLRRHMMKHHQLRYSLYGCRTCGSQFSTFLELMSHHRVVHNFKAMNGYTKKSDSFPVGHTKVTSKDPAKFVCSCGKKYRIQKSLASHIYRCRNPIEKKAIAGVAAKKDKVPSTSTKQRHGLVKPKNAECKMVRVRCICSARFESRRELIKHVQRFEKSYNEVEEED